MGAIRGVVATIRWHYYNAAAIEGYTLSRDPKTRQWYISGRIVIADAFKLSQRPLRLVVPHKTGEWIFPILSAVPRAAGPFTAELGAPIKEATVNVRLDAPSGIRPA